MCIELQYQEIKLPCNANAIPIQTQHTLATTPVQLVSANNSIRIGSLADIVCQDFRVSQRTKNETTKYFYIYLCVNTDAFHSLFHKINKTM